MTVWIDFNLLQTGKKAVAQTLAQDLANASRERYTCGEHQQILIGKGAS